MKPIFKLGLSAVLVTAIMLSVFFGSCKKQETAAHPKPTESLLQEIASDPDFVPIAYMLNKDYMNLRMSLHDSDDITGRTDEMIRATRYIAAYGYRRNTNSPIPYPR
jgi:hypothetical protein